MTKLYAEGTDVSIERSRAEIERLLRQHGASGFFSSWDEKKGASMIGFRLSDRMFRLSVLTPDASCAPRSKYAEKPEAKAKRVRSWVEKEERRRWRAQLLLLKAKLEMIATGETTVEREFLADMVLPDGSTVGQRAIPALAASYATGTMPSLPMLAGGS